MGNGGQAVHRTQRLVSTFLRMNKIHFLKSSFSWIWPLPRFCAFLSPTIMVFRGKPAIFGNVSTIGGTHFFDFHDYGRKCNNFPIL